MSATPPEVQAEAVSTGVDDGLSQFVLPSSLGVLPSPPPPQHAGPGKAHHPEREVGGDAIAEALASGSLGISGGGGSGCISGGDGGGGTGSDAAPPPPVAPATAPATAAPPPPPPQQQTPSEGSSSGSGGHGTRTKNGGTSTSSSKVAGGGGGGGPQSSSSCVTETLKLYVRNLPPGVTEAALRRVFDSYGSIVTLQQCTERAGTGHCAYITYASQVDARAALRGTCGQTPFRDPAAASGGRGAVPLNVRFAESLESRNARLTQKQRKQQSGAGGGGGGGSASLSSRGSGVGSAALPPPPPYSATTLPVAALPGQQQQQQQQPLILGPGGGAGFQLVLPPGAGGPMLMGGLPGAAPLVYATPFGPAVPLVLGPGGFLPPQPQQPQQGPLQPQQARQQQATPMMFVYAQPQQQSQ